MTETLRPDPTLRKWTLVTVAAGTVIGIAVVLEMRAYLDELRVIGRADPAAAIDAMLSVLRWLFVGLEVTLIAFGAYTLRYCWRAHRAGVFPPPGTRVIRATEVRRGESARKRAVAGMVAAVAVIVVGAVAPLLMYRMIEAVVERAVTGTNASTAEPRPSIFGD